MKSDHFYDFEDYVPPAYVWKTSEQSPIETAENIVRKVTITLFSASNPMVVNEIL